MVPPVQFKSQVCDIRRASSPVPRQIVADVNALYFVYYPNFHALAAAGGRVPIAYQTAEYPKWIAKASRQKAGLFTSPVTVGELVRLVEYAELEALWITSPANFGKPFSPIVAKQARYDFHSHLARIRQCAMSVVAAMHRQVELLPRFKSEIIELDAVLAEWAGSAGDFNDAFLVANAKLAGISDVISDDADLVTFAGIRVHTANKNTVERAHAAGMLI